MILAWRYIMPLISLGKDHRRFPLESIAIPNYIYKRDANAGRVANEGTSSIVKSPAT
jgi:hypothetical protein